MGIGGRLCVEMHSQAAFSLPEAAFAKKILLPGAGNRVYISRK